MSTTSVVVEQKKILGRVHVESDNAIFDRKISVKNNKFKALRISIYRHILETAVSSILIFAFLAVYKISGLHAWWVHQVGEITLTP
jgi:hypothetical protein